MTKRTKTHRANGTAAADLLTKATHLEFAGHNYNLVMTNGALIEFEQLTGLSTLMDGERIFGKPTLGSLSAMLYVLLKRDGCSLSRDTVTELITQDKVQSVYAAILAARVQSFTKAKPQTPTSPATTSPS